MKLLGDWNWYLPKWLEWLPRLEHDEADAVSELESAPVSA
jgi:RND superfamily putative drug exporter